MTSVGGTSICHPSQVIAIKADFRRTPLSKLLQHRCCRPRVFVAGNHCTFHAASHCRPTIVSACVKPAWQASRPWLFAQGCGSNDLSANGTPFGRGAVPVPSTRGLLPEAFHFPRGVAATSMPLMAHRLAEALLPLGYPNGLLHVAFHHNACQKRLRPGPPCPSREVNHSPLMASRSKDSLPTHAGGVVATTSPLVALRAPEAPRRTVPEKKFCSRPVTCLLGWRQRPCR